MNLKRHIKTGHLLLILLLWALPIVVFGSATFDPKPGEMWWDQTVLSLLSITVLISPLVGVFVDRLTVLKYHFLVLLILVIPFWLFSFYLGRGYGGGRHIHDYSIEFFWYDLTSIIIIAAVLFFVIFLSSWLLSLFKWYRLKQSAFAGYGFFQKTCLLTGLYVLLAAGFLAFNELTEFVITSEFLLNTLPLAFPLIILLALPTWGWFMGKYKISEVEVKDHPSLSRKAGLAIVIVALVVLAFFFFYPPNHPDPSSPTPYDI